MKTNAIRRWLLVVIAVLGLALVVPVVSAHGNDMGTEIPPYDGTTEEWVIWMETHMTNHMGPDATEWSEDHMGLTIEEMSAYMADGGYYNGGYYNHGYGMYGQSHCCYDSNRLVPTRERIPMVVITTQ